MTRRRLVAAACVALGVVVGLLLISGAFSAVREAPIAARMAPTPPHDVPAPTLAPGAGNRALTARPAEPPPTSVAPPSNALPRGGVIKGVVRTDTGESVAGVDVERIDETGTSSGPSATSRRTTTDSEGLFRFLDCRESSHNIVAGTTSADGALSGIVRGVFPGDEIVVVLRRATAVLNVQIVDHEGVAIAGATVECEGIAAAPKAQTTDASGRVAMGPVPDDWIRIRVTSPDLLPATRAMRPSSEPTIVRMESATRTKVFVSSEVGPVAGALVRLQHGNGGDSGVSDGDGSLTLRAPVQPTPFLLGVEARGYPPFQLRSSELKIEDGVIRVLLGRGRTMVVSADGSDPFVLRVEANFHGGKPVILVESEFSKSDSSVTVDTIPTNCMVVVQLKRASGEMFEWTRSSHDLPKEFRIPARGPGWSSNVQISVTPELWARAGLGLVVASQELDSSQLLRRRVRVPASGTLELPLCSSTGSELSLWTSSGDRVGSPVVYDGGPPKLRFNLPKAEEVRGSVRDRQGVPVTGATVLAITESGAVLGRFASDELGEFRAIYPVKSDTRVGLTASRTGVGPPPEPTYVNGPDGRYTLTIDD